QETSYSYSHWGLSRVYGEGAAQQALGEAHSACFLATLRTSLRTLRDDVEVSSRGKQKPAEEYIKNLRGRWAALLPTDLGGGSARHFSSVLHALSSLASNQTKSQPRATPPSYPRCQSLGRSLPHPVDDVRCAPALEIRDGAGGRRGL